MIKNNDGREFSYGFTHGDEMHADDVYTAAFLRLIDEDFKIVRQVRRSDSIPNEKDVLVFDIGMGEFDHHQSLERGAKLRDDGRKFSAFGLVVKNFYKSLNLTEEQYHDLDKNFIRLIEDVDNGCFEVESAMSNFVSGHNLTWKELDTFSFEEASEILNNNFEKAVDFAKEVLRTQIDKSFNSSNEDIKDLYNEALADLFNLEKKNSLIETFEQAKNLMENEVYEKMHQKIDKFEEKLKDDNSSYLSSFKYFDKTNEKHKEIIKDSIEHYFNSNLKRIVSEIDAKDVIMKAYKESNSNYIILPNGGMPWKGTLLNEINNGENDREIDFVIFKSRDDSYLAMCVPPSFEEMYSQRIPFSEKIAGLNSSRPEDIPYLDNYSDNLVFCHPAKFVAGAKTLEDTISLVEKTTIEFQNANKIEIAE